MIEATYIDPCQQIRAAIIEHLQGLCNGFARPISTMQIRAILDVSGEMRDSCGIVIGCDNKGEHWGANNGGRLIDVQPKICIYTHINDDADGAICNALVNDVLNAIRTITYNLQGWQVMWTGNWTVGEVTLSDSFRQCEMSAILPLVRQF